MIIAYFLTIVIAWLIMRPVIKMDDFILIEPHEAIAIVLIPIVDVMVAIVLLVCLLFDYISVDGENIAKKFFFIKDKKR